MHRRQALPQGGETGSPPRPARLSTPAVERLNGFKAGVKENAKIDVVAEQAAQLAAGQGADRLRRDAGHPNIEAVCASNDMIAARGSPPRVPANSIR